MFSEKEQEADATSHDSLFKTYIVDNIFGSALFDNIKAVFPCVAMSPEANSLHTLMTTVSRKAEQA